MEDFKVDQDKRTGETLSVRTRLTGWLRSFLFFVLVLALFGLLAWFLVVKPLQDEVAALSTERDEAHSQIATLEAARPLQDINSLLADANTARFELMRNRAPSASAALLSSEQTLLRLRTLLGERYATTVDDIQERLDLVLADIESDDMLAALSDLDVLVNILTQLQRTVAE